MACFIVPLATAAATTAVKAALPKAVLDNPFAARLPWLEKMMYGGSLILALEHICNGEIIFRPPFLTAMTEGPEAVSAMLHEMATRGVAMTAVVLAVWVGMVLAARNKAWYLGRFAGTLALVACGTALMFAVDMLADISF